MTNSHNFCKENWKLLPPQKRSLGQGVVITRLPTGGWYWLSQNLDNSVLDAFYKPFVRWLTYLFCSSPRRSAVCQSRAFSADQASRSFSAEAPTMSAFSEEKRVFVQEFFSIVFSGHDGKWHYLQGHSPGVLDWQYLNQSDVLDYQEWKMTSSENFLP